MYKLLDRGIQPKGFFNDDATRLQEVFDKEHEMDREIRMEQKIRAVAINYLKETNQQRRMERENELRQEMMELTQNDRLSVWIQLINANTTPMYADLRLNCIGTRVLCKNLMLNHSLRSLSLNGNGLDDTCGKHIAALLRSNTALQRLELERNQLGSAATCEIAQALSENDTLVALSLESNDLTNNEHETGGMTAIASMLAVNSSLKSLNLWRTMLGPDGGKQLVAGMVRNGTLLCLEFGCNRILNSDAIEIVEKLRQNQSEFATIEAMENSIQSSLNQAAQNERARQQEVEERKANVSLQSDDMGEAVFNSLSRWKGWKNVVYNVTRNVRYLNKNVVVSCKSKRTDCVRFPLGRLWRLRRNWSLKESKRKRKKVRKRVRNRLLYKRNCTAMAG